MIKGFKEFISRGSAVDLAVGVVIGAAFGAIVTALVDDVLNPLIGGIFGRPNFDDLWVITFQTPVAEQLAADGLAEDEGLAQVRPFAVLTALINFLLVAAAVYFALVLPMNKLAERRGDKDEEETAEDVLVLTEIRDLLAAQAGQAPKGGATRADQSPPGGTGG